MFLTILFIVLIFSLTVTGDRVQANRSPITLSMSKRVNLTSIHNLVRHDQTRAKLLKAKGVAKASGLNFHNDAVIDSQADNQALSYLASVGIGNSIPPTTYSLIVDTGSGNTWIGANKAYIKTGTSVATSNTVSVTSGSGSFFGKEFFDTVTITPDLVIQHQAIGVATSIVGFSGVDGVLGLGPAELTVGTLSPATGSSVPTVVDNAFAQGLISADEIGIAFRPTTAAESLNGVITWGGTDSSIFTGTISFSPITTTSPASSFRGINQSIRYGSSTTILSQTAGIIDAGTTLTLIASDAFNVYKTSTGAVLDNNIGLLSITSTQFSQLQSLFFQTSSGANFELTANAQIWPRSLNPDIGGTSSGIYLIVGDIGSNSGSGLDFINGLTFMERFYVVFDTTNKRVGLASTPFTFATTN